MPAGSAHRPVYAGAALPDPARVAAALGGASPIPFWLDDPGRPEARPALTGRHSTDLLVVGGGYSGLWTALRAKERDPEREVLLIEARRIGWAASGRNGGFCSASLTHGDANGESRFPEEMDELRRLGAENLADLVATIQRYGIDAELEQTGEMTVATEEYQVAGLQEAYEDATAAGATGVRFLDADAVQEEIKSPVYRAALETAGETVLVNPAKLAWGLAKACADLGVRIAEDTPALGLTKDVDGVVVRLSDGEIHARQVALGTNIYPSLVKRVRPFVVPVWDYALVTEPLTDEQWESIGWAGRHGLSDASNLFHYYRRTADGRILWGGYDAIYPRGGKIRAADAQRPETFAKLAGHFWDTFPQLADIRFSHAWGGVIDTCSRFMPFFGTAYAGSVAYALGFTGLGVASTRFGADVMLDLLDGECTERTELRMVRTWPIPFPPEPFAGPIVELTRHSIEKADANEGKRNLLLRTMDTFGVGFDS